MPWSGKQRARPGVSMRSTRAAGAVVKRTRCCPSSCPWRKPQAAWNAATSRGSSARRRGGDGGAVAEDGKCGDRADDDGERDAAGPTADAAAAGGGEGGGKGFGAEQGDGVRIHGGWRG